MDNRFKTLLANLPKKAPRSRLEPYRELIDELLHRHRTYRDIVGILATSCQITVCVSTLHEFVRGRLKSNDKRSQWDNPMIASVDSKPVSGGAGMPQSGEIQPRIVANTVRTADTSDLQDFQFDAGEPLRLRKPGKREATD
jgi:IS30 family transposase